MNVIRPQFVQVEIQDATGITVTATKTMKSLLTTTGVGERSHGLYHSRILGIDAQIFSQIATTVMNKYAFLVYVAVKMA